MSATSTQTQGPVPLISGKTVLGVVGVVLAIMAVGLVTATGWMMWAYGTQRSGDGYFTTPTAQVSTDTYALISTEVDLGAIRNDWLPASWLGTVQVIADSRDEAPVFIGIGPSTDVDDYLEGVAHAEVTRIASGEESEYRVEDGTAAPATQPDDEGFWVASSEGEGRHSVEWDIEEGEWTVLIMNADASPDVAVEVTAGARSPWFMGAVVVVGIGALICAALAILTFFFAFRGRRVDREVVAHLPERQEPVLSGVDDDAAR